MGSFFRDFFTGADNKSGEVGRVLWALGVVALIGYQGYAIHEGQTFNPQDFGLAVAAILAGGGFGIAAKDRAVPAPAEAS